jgi:large subunit ribosomal protein L18
MKSIAKIKALKRTSRRARIRARIFGTKETPRLNVFRSLKHINAQLIDDNEGKTIIFANDNELKMKKATKVERAKEVGKLLAKKAVAQDIKSVVFDRGGYQYHGRVKAVAEGAREGGLQF